MVFLANRDVSTNLTHNIDDIEEQGLSISNKSDIVEPTKSDTEIPTIPITDAKNNENDVIITDTSK